MSIPFFFTGQSNIYIFFKNIFVLVQLLFMRNMCELQDLQRFENTCLLLLYSTLLLTVPM